MAKYIVEIIFWQPKTRVNEETGHPAIGVELSTHMVGFENPNENTAKHEAQKYMDDVIRYGLKAKPSSPIVKSVILPSAIMQVGLVDEEKYQEMMQDASMLNTEEDGTLIPSDVEVPPALVDDAAAG